MRELLRVFHFALSELLHKNLISQRSLKDVMLTEIDGYSAKRTTYREQMRREDRKRERERERERAVFSNHLNEITKNASKTAEGVVVFDFGRRRSTR